MVMAIILPRQKCKLREFPPARLCGFVDSHHLRQMHKNCRQILHFTPHFHFARFSGVKCRVYLQFLLPLAQTAAGKYVTQVLGGDNCG